MNDQVKVTWIILRTFAHSITLQAWVYENYIHFVLIHTTDHIFPVLPNKYLVNQGAKKTPPQKLATGIKTSVSNPCVLFCPCVLQKATAHFDTKALNMRHQ